MRQAILAALATAAFATPTLAAEPATIILPTPVVSALAQYLAQRPYGEVAQMIGQMQQCVAVQVPNAQGAIVSHGECPAVTQAEQERDAAQAKAIAEAVAKQQAADAKH